MWYVEFSNDGRNWTRVNEQALPRRCAVELKRDVEVFRCVQARLVRAEQGA